MKHVGLSHDLSVGNSNMCQEIFFTTNIPYVCIMVLVPENFPLNTTSNFEVKGSWCLQMFTHCSIIWSGRICHDLAESSSELTLEQDVNKKNKMNNEKIISTIFGVGLVNAIYENLNHCMLMILLPALLKCHQITSLDNPKCGYKGVGGGGAFSMAPKNGPLLFLPHIVTRFSCASL